MIRETEYAAGTLVADPIGGDNWQVMQSVYDAEDDCNYLEFCGQIATGIVDADGDRDAEVAKQIKEEYGPAPAVILDGVQY